MEIKERENNVRLALKSAVDRRGDEALNLISLVVGINALKLNDIMNGRKDITISELIILESFM